MSGIQWLPNQACTLAPSLQVMLAQVDILVDMCVKGLTDQSAKVSRPCKQAA
jgi:hypothetical protein